jgi:hypothetical protein
MAANATVLGILRNDSRESRLVVFVQWRRGLMKRLTLRRDFGRAAGRRDREHHNTEEWQPHHAD